MNSSSWSISLGRWGNVYVRLHITLPLLVLCAFLMSELSIYRRASFEIERVAFIVLLGLVAVAIHAASHVMAAARQGIVTSELILAPWGEFTPVESPSTAEAALNTQLSGIMANALMCAVSAMILWLAGDASIGEMLVPLDSRVLLQSNNHLIVIRWAFCLNYCLVLMNLIPASPFDGGRILKAALHLVMPHLSHDTVRLVTLITGRVAGVLLITLAIAVGQGDGRGLLPAWFPLTVLGIVALFSFEAPTLPGSLLIAARGTDRQPIFKSLNNTAELPPERADEWEPRAGAQSPEPSRPDDMHEGPFAQWLQERRASERLRRQELERNDESRADEILARLHQQGPEALSAEDRRVLERVSDRIRRRQEKQS
jgi:stage IV sporulation protein FB